MNTFSKNFDDIIKSSRGQHLSLYLKNDSFLRNKTQYYIDQIQRLLLKHHGFDKTRNFIKPLYQVLRDKQTLKELGQYVGIFQKEGYIRMIGIPQPVEDFFVLSETFHVKPLLNHIQNNKTATLIFCKEESVKIYTVNAYKETFVSEFRLDLIMKELSKYDDKKVSQSYFMLSKQLLVNWLESTFDFKKQSLGRDIYLYGENQMAYFIKNCLKSVTDHEVHALRTSSDLTKNSAMNWCRGQLIMDARRELNREVKSFNFVEDNEYVSFDIQEIVRNLIAGRVKRLMIASDQSIYGKIDRLTGEITYTHFHKDHEDDDILDDIAQIAIEMGITPILVKRNRIRKQRTIKAVITRQPYKSHEWEVA